MQLAVKLGRSGAAYRALLVGMLARGYVMRTYRGLLLATAAFGVSLGALGVAAISAWYRCDGGADCSSDLALGIVGLAPASLLLIVVVLLVRKEASSALVARIMLVATLAVAASPLAAFVIRDAVTLVIMMLLFGALAALALVDDQRWIGREPHDDADTGRGNASPPGRQSDVTSMDSVPRLSSQDGALGLRIETPGDASMKSREPDASRTRRADEPFTRSAVLAIVGPHDFEAFSELYERLVTMSEVSRVRVRYYDDTCAVIELTLTAPSLPETIVRLLKDLSSPSMSVAPSELELFRERRGRTPRGR